MVTDAQVRLLRRKLGEDKTQEIAAAASGMCIRSARKWQTGKLPSESSRPRHWRTRSDPFDRVWESEIIPLLRTDSEGRLQATTLFEHVHERYPGEFAPGQLRTLQRRLRDWRAIHGPDREVFFEQEHPPGREAAVDFTHASSLGVTVVGEPLDHLLFQLVLSFSGWTWVDVAFGETFEALVDGIQGAFWDVGGVTEVLRSDNLSAATHELRTGGRSLTKRFAAVLDHYGIVSTRIRPGKSHENGIAEQANHRTKTAIDQALLIRGHRDFNSLEAYRAFVRDVVERRCNRPVVDKVADEKRALRPLPATRIPAYSVYRAQVRRWSTVRVSGRTYSVPSRLIGHEVEVRQHPDVVEVFYRDRLVETMPRLRGEVEHRIDYRHIIWSLVRKPGAFARYRYREELFPTLVFRRAYDALVGWRGERADVEYVRILHLAAATMESLVEKALARLLEQAQPFEYATVAAIAKPERPPIPEIRIAGPDLTIYDRLLTGTSS